jgi:hypothetical protein
VFPKLESPVMAFGEPSIPSTAVVWFVMSSRSTRNVPEVCLGIALYANQERYFVMNSSIDYEDYLLQIRAGQIDCNMRAQIIIYYK